MFCLFSGQVKIFENFLGLHECLFVTFSLSYIVYRSFYHTYVCIKQYIQRCLTDPVIFSIVDVTSLNMNLADDIQIILSDVCHLHTFEQDPHKFSSIYQACRFCWYQQIFHQQSQTHSKIQCPMFRISYFAYTLLRELLRLLCFAWHCQHVNLLKLSERKTENLVSTVRWIQNDGVCWA